MGLCKLWEHGSLKQRQGDLQVTVEDAIASKGLCGGWGGSAGLREALSLSKFLHGAQIQMFLLTTHPILNFSICLETGASEMAAGEVSCHQVL